MKTRRILSVILTVVFVLSTFTFVAAAEGTGIVYLDPENGNGNGSSPESAVGTIADAVAALDGNGGTIYLIGTLSMPAGRFPASPAPYTIEGYGDGATIVTPASSAVGISADTTFRNLQLALGSNAHLDSYSYKLTFDEGVTIPSGMIHLGTCNSQVSDSIHLVIDGGMTLDRGVYTGAYNSTHATLVAGDATFEILNGTLANLRLAQDGWESGHQEIGIGGNINVRVGSKGVVSSMSPGGRLAQVQGYLQVIVVDGGKMVDPPNLSTNFVNHNDYYWLELEDTTRGSVDFTSKAGVYNVTCDEGFLACFHNQATGTDAYVEPGEYTLPSTGRYRVTFADNRKLAPKSAAITINPATPGDSEWPLSVDLPDVFEISAEVSPADETVAYGKAYTYNVTLTAINEYVIPEDFTFTINGLEKYSKSNVEGYRISNYVQTANEISFTYVAGMTAGEEGKVMVSYTGGLGSALIAGMQAPDNVFYATGETIQVADNCYVMGGYVFAGYSDGSQTYQPGEDYLVGDSDVVFTAQWELQNPISIIFAGGGSTGGTAPDTITSFEGMYVTLPENTYAKTGYDFTYWSDEEGTTYNPGDLFLVPTAHVTLTANWAPKANAGSFIYVDAENGASGNSGESYDQALDSIAAAIDAAAGADATVIVIGSAPLTTHAHVDGHITITGYDNAAELTLTGGVALCADTTIENIAVNAKSGAYIASNGYETVYGPNIASVGTAYAFVDGGIGASIDEVNTKILSGVELGTYYLGGANLTAGGDAVTGGVNVTLENAHIGTVDLSPMGGAANTRIGTTIIYNINGAVIDKFIASQPFRDASGQPNVFIFNDGTIPAQIDPSIVSNLGSAGRGYLFIIDSGVGGSVSYSAFARNQLRITATAAVEGGSVYSAVNDGAFTKRTAAFSASRYDSGSARNLNKVRYGDPFSELIEIAVAAPTGGAEAFSITASSANENCKVQVDSWSPALVGGKFNYETFYTANVRITPNEGLFFDDSNLPTVMINDAAATAVLNSDGTLTASYKFTEATTYAPLLNVTFEAGAPGVTGTVPAATRWEHMSIDNYLPTAVSMTNLGFRFAGWLCSIDNKVYQANTAYAMTGNTDVVFTAQWQQRGSWELANVLILYDLSAYGRDKARNPQFDPSDTPILMPNSFTTLEHEINGTKSLKSTTFDHEKVQVIVSDKGSNPMMINDYTIDNRMKVPATEYGHLTIVYYYESENPVAEGGRGSMTYGSCTLADGTLSSWYQGIYESTNTVRANRWSAITFDFSDLAEAKGIPEGANIHQFHIYPIGQKTCAELGDATLYLKSMYFSKLPAIIE